MTTYHFADPLPLDMPDEAYRVWHSLRQSLATGHGIAKRASRAPDVKDIRPRYTDTRFARIVDSQGHGVNPNTHHTASRPWLRDTEAADGRINFFPDAFVARPIIQIDILDTYSLGAPRSSVGRNSIDDVISGQYKPAKFTALEYSPYHYAKVAAACQAVERKYVQGRQFAAHTPMFGHDRFRPFDPTPYFEDVCGFVRFIGR